MLRDPESLIDIQASIRRILRYTDRINRTELEHNDEKLSAILYQITIIGEAARRISAEFCDQHSEIPWREIIGMRNVIVHEYNQLDYDVIWDVIQNKLPELLILIEPFFLE